jgi:hypothetical protein
VFYSTTVGELVTIAVTIVLPRRVCDPRHSDLFPIKIMVAVDELLRETEMPRHPSLTSEECRRRAEEAQTLAAQTQDDWERELFQRITTQWHVLAVHKKGKEENAASR